MDFFEDLKKKIRRSAPVGAELEFSYPPRPELGDLSAACFRLDENGRRQPAPAAARDLSATLAADKNFKKYFDEVKIYGLYANLVIKPLYLAEKIIRAVKKEKNIYAHNALGRGEKVMLEYANANTHKEYHVGHLRNIAYGDAVGRLLTANGYKVIPVSYINDFGIHTAKTLWYWQKEPAFKDGPEDRGYLLGKCYAAASQELAREPEYKEAVAAVMKEIEKRHGDNYELWRETRIWSLKYFARVYQELGVKFKHIFYESEMIALGARIVKDLLKRGIFKKSQGAVVADLDDFGLGVLPILRSDGTALYPVADLELAKEKFEKYHVSQSLYVVDVRQSLYFKQLFKILTLMGHNKPLKHLAYDFVTLPAGMMSSRAGNVITYEELKDKVWQKLKTETKKRHPDWTASRVELVAKDLALSTIKFEMLKVNADKIITFNLEEALRFDGYTACYLLYSYARLRSIVRKAGFNLFRPRPVPKELRQDQEKRLLIKIAKYPEIIRSAGRNYNPSEVAKYLFELAQVFNDYYHETPILKAPPKVKAARLALIKMVAQTLKNGFNILGLKILEEI